MMAKMQQYAENILLFSYHCVYTYIAVLMLRTENRQDIHYLCKLHMHEISIDNV